MLHIRYIGIGHCTGVVKSSRSFRSHKYTSDHRFRKTKILSVNLLINFNIWFWCSKEPSHWDGSFEYPQHMFWLGNKKLIFWYALLTKSLRHMALQNIILARMCTLLGLIHADNRTSNICSHAIFMRISDIQSWHQVTSNFWPQTFCFQTRPNRSVYASTAASKHTQPSTKKQFRRSVQSCIPFGSSCDPLGNTQMPVQFLLIGNRG